MLENKEKKNLSWVVTDGAERFGAPIFSDKVLRKYISIGSRDPDNGRTSPESL
jgi:hypothetical protein